MTKEFTLPDKLSTAVALLYGLEHDAIEFVGYSQNYVFRAKDQRGQPLIARLTEPDHRSREEILAELHWVDFLKAHGVRACGATQPHGHDVCETLQVEGRDYFSVLFEHAPGHAITGRDLTPTLSEQHGKLLGQLHRLAADYNPPLGTHRPQWYESRLYSRDAEEHLLPEQPLILDVLQDLVAQGMALPRERDACGLIHLDLHYNNLFLDEGTPHLFDFDNSSYGFYANDVAKALHGSVLTYHRRKERFDDSPFESPLVDEALQTVWSPFWNGYRSEHEPQPSLFEMLPLFFMLVDMKDYVHAHRHGIPERDPRIAKAFRRLQKRIESGVLPVRFDFIKGEPLPTPVKVGCTTR